MASASQAGFGQFPPTLDTIPEEQRVAASFGWTPAALGVAGVAGGLAVLVYNQGSSDGLVGGGVLLLLGGLFLYWEYRRRQNRTVLVPQGGVVGVYRKGAFDLALAPNQITYYQLNWLNTARFLIIPGAALFGLLSAAWNDKPNSPETWILLAVGGGVGLVLLGLVVHSRILLKHFYVPRTKGRAEKIMLTRELATKIYKS